PISGRLTVFDRSLVSVLRPKLLPFRPVPLTSSHLPRAFSAHHQVAFHHAPSVASLAQKPWPKLGSGLPPFLSFACRLRRAFLLQPSSAPLLLPINSSRS